jgi:hypothetical protein
MSTSSPNVHPAHPYALYQQTSFEEGDEQHARPVVPPIHVGFTGRNATYQRRIGPEGEELDVLGPDGYTEQLPPYSKYPEEGQLAEKTPRVITSPVSPVSPLHSSPLSATPSPHSGASRAPDPLIRMGQPSPGPRSPSIVESSPTDAEQSRGESRNTVAHEKKSKGHWKEKKYKKLVCGMLPLWSVLMLAFLAIFLAVVAGGIIGGMLSNGKRREKQ